MTATAETKTFPTRQIVQRHQLDQLAVGAYFLDGFGRGVVKSDDNWFKLDDHDFEVGTSSVTLPAEVLDEGDVPFQLGDRVTLTHSPYDALPNGAEGTVTAYNGMFWEVRVNGIGDYLFYDQEIAKIEDAQAEVVEVGDIVRITSTMWDGHGAAIRSGLEGEVKSLPGDDNPYFMVNFVEYGSETDNFPLREHEFVLVRKAPKLGDFVHSFTVQLADFSQELLNLIFGTPAPLTRDEVEAELEALRNGTVLVDPNNPFNIFVKRGGDFVKPGSRDTYNDEALKIATERGLTVVHEA